MNRPYQHLYLLLAFILVACGGGTSETPSAGGIDTTTLAPGASGAHRSGDSVQVADTAGPVVTHVATIATDSGEVVIELFGKDAPKAVNNFVGLAKKGFYDGIAFHRVVPGFVAQAGDPQSKDESKREFWGQGGESIYGGTFDDELDAAKPSAKLGYATGMVAMANSGPNTNSSQFFIVLGDGAAAQLQYLYTIFGRVRDGQESLMRIESTGYQGEMPRTPARITGIKVKEVSA